MTDEVFRPQKKAITSQEVQGDTQQSGLQISGTPPKEFLDMINKKPAQPVQSGPQPQSVQLPPEFRIQGSSRLEELIEGINRSGISYEEVTLPSKGRFYDGTNGPADGVLHIRPMTGGEEAILATPRYAKRGDAINMIFNNCLREKYKSENLLSRDRTYLLIYLRGISYSHEYSVEIKDPDDDTAFNYDINLSELELEFCPDDFGFAQLSDILPTTGYHFEYRLPTGRDDQAVQDYRDNRAKNFNLNNTADDSLLWKTANLIVDIEGLKNKNEIQALLKKLPINDVAYLRNVINNPPFGVKTKIPVVNPYTLREFEVELPIDINFFLPQVKKKTQPGT